MLLSCRAASQDAVGVPARSSARPPPPTPRRPSVLGAGSRPPANWESFSSNLTHIGPCLLLRQPSHTAGARLKRQANAANWGELTS